MPALPPDQVARLAAHVAAAGPAGALADELTDHLCCRAEDEIAAGHSPNEAVAIALATLPSSNLRGINRRVFFSTKLKPMLLQFVPVAAAVSGILLLSPRPAPEVTVTPCLAENYEVVFPHQGPPTASPIPGVDMRAELSSGFGLRIHPFSKKEVLHKGIDIKAKTGTPVVATADGTVLFAAEDGLNGLTVRIRHADGYVTAYKHLSAYSVAAGDRVQLGDHIGAVGSTGASTAPHLHYEVIKDDQPVDPLALLDR